MTRNKIIGAFVAVWCAVCLSYVGVRTAVAALANGTASVSEGVAGEDATGQGVDREGVGSTSDTANLEEQEDVPTPNEQTGSLEPTGQSDPEGQANPEGPADPEGPDTTAQSDPATQTMPDDSSSTSELSAQNETGQNVAAQDTDQEGTDTQDIGEEPDQEKQVAYVPSLSEYLSHFTCGSCHRNCSLSNPRCHNGSRLARVKAEEYYNLYG